MLRKLKSWRPDGWDVAAFVAGFVIFGSLIFLLDQSHRAPERETVRIDLREFDKLSPK